MKNRKSIFNSVERGLLILTFLCTLVGTIYAIRTAQKAIEQASIELRPWIVIEKSRSIFDGQTLELQYQVKNIGKIPAYLSFEFKTYVNDELLVLNPTTQSTQNDNLVIADPSAFSTIILALMPNQPVLPGGLIIKDAYLKKAMNKELDVKISQSLKVKYGTSKDTLGEYYVYQKVEFDQNDLPKKIKSQNQVGIWNHVDSDFR